MGWFRAGAWPWPSRGRLGAGGRRGVGDVDGMGCDHAMGSGVQASRPRFVVRVLLDQTRQPHLTSSITGDQIRWTNNRDPLTGCHAPHYLSGSGNTLVGLASRSSRRTTTNISLRRSSHCSQGPTVAYSSMRREVSFATVQVL